MWEAGSEAVFWGCYRVPHGVFSAELLSETRVSSWHAALMCDFSPEETNPDQSLSRRKTGVVLGWH